MFLLRPSTFASAGSLSLSEVAWLHTRDIRNAREDQGRNQRGKRKQAPITEVAAGRTAIVQSWSPWISGTETPSLARPGVKVGFPIVLECDPPSHHGRVRFSVYGGSNEKEDPCSLFFLYHLASNHRRTREM